MGKSSWGHERRIAALEEKVRGLEDALLFLMDGLDGIRPRPTADMVKCIIGGIVKYYRELPNDTQTVG